MALTKISTAGVKDDIVTTAKIADDAVTEALIADDSVDEARLKISNAGSNGQALTKQSGNTGGLTWATISSGGATGADYNDSVKTRFGTGNDLEIYHDGSHSRIADVGTGSLIISGSTLSFLNQAKNETLAEFTENGAVNLYYDNSKKFETTSSGVSVTGAITTTNAATFNSVFASTNNSTRATIELNGKDSSGNQVELRLGGFGDTNRGEIYTVTNHNIGFATNNAGAQVIIDTSGHLNIPNDSGKIRLGTSADLEIYHDGSYSYIDNTHSGGLWIRGGTSTYQIGIQAKNSENSILCTGDGAVNLYYDASKKFETTTEGAQVTGQLDILDDYNLRLGNSQDFRLLHSGSWNYIQNHNSKNLAIQVNGTENAIIALPNAEVQLYYDGVKKFETASNGIQLLDELGLNDAKAAMFGDSDDMKIYHNGTHSYIWNTQGDLQIRGDSLYICSTGGEGYLEGTANGSTKIFYDNSTKLETKSDGVLINGELQSTTLDVNGNSHLDGTLTVTNNIYQADDDVHYFGSGNDLYIFHDGTNSYINNLTGNLEIRVKSGEAAIHMVPNGTTKLYYDGSKKVETTSGGVNIAGALSTTGHISPTANNTYDLGDSTYRWRNIYTNDLNLSNEGSTNSVDGTWGNYTIQEGEDDLFLINRRNGKKYKFNLTEVS